jgi:hypothetical protein
MAVKTVASMRQPATYRCYFLRRRRDRTLQVLRYDDRGELSIARVYVRSDALDELSGGNFLIICPIIFGSYALQR